LYRFCGGSDEVAPVGGGVTLGFPRSNFAFGLPPNGVDSGATVDVAAGDAGTFCNSPRLTLPIGVVTGEAEALDVAMGVPEALG
jgi:hypothetical protein